MVNKRILVTTVISALILLFLVSALGILAFSGIVNAASVSNATISAVQSGTTNNPNVTLGPDPNPIGVTFSIDIRIDNAGPFWGWTVPTVTWNPQVLSLTQVQEGPFLVHNTGGDPTLFVGNSKVLFDNTNGSIDAGLTEAIAGSSVSINASGVLATLIFTVTGYGNSAINIAGGNLRSSSNDNIGINVTCNSATVVVNNASSSSSSSSAPAATITPSPAGNSTPPSTADSTTGSIPEFPSSLVLLFLVGSAFATISAFAFLRKKTNIQSKKESVKH